MNPGQASITAQRVAAQRLGFERVPAAYGDPAADDRLARDVAGPGETWPAGLMTRYLAARTAFFDRVVVAALERGITQVVVAAAGYDGRSLRYAKPGVRWFEVDHPDTQADKLERLDRLGLRPPHVTYVPVDFTTGDVGASLVAAGVATDRAALFVCEGVAVYLERHVLEALLRGLRAAAGPRSRLAISLSVETGSPVQALRRARFRTAVAAIGEPARSSLTAAEADAVFTSAGWHTVPGPGDSDRASAAGLVLAEPRA